MTGNEIMQITGFKPGPVIGEIMKAIRQRQYDNLASSLAIPLDQQKEEARQIALSYIPEPLERNKIQDIVYNRTGLRPARPSPGQQSWVQIIRDRLRQQRIDNPNLTEDEAKKILHELIDSGELDMYQT